MRGAVNGGAEEISFFSAVRFALLRRHAIVFVGMNVFLMRSLCTFASLSLARAGRFAGLPIIFGACKAQRVLTNRRGARERRVGRLRARARLGKA